MVMAGLDVSSRDHDPLLGIQRPPGSRPDARGGNRKVERAHEVAAVEFGRLTRVENDDSSGEGGPQCLGIERLRATRVVILAQTVEKHHSVDVRRSGRQALRHRGHELILGHHQHRVVAKLEPDRRARLRAQSRPPAQRAANVRRPHLDVVAERDQRLQTRAQDLRAFSGVQDEVGPGDVADQERIPCEQQPRLFSPGEVADREREMLGSMPRRCDRPHTDVPDGDLVPGVDSVIAIVSRIGRPVRPGAGRAGEAYAARYVVCVVVRVDDVHDAQPLDAGQLEVLLDVPARIHDDRFTAIA
jgi:hypothetical protein